MPDGSNLFEQDADACVGPNAILQLKAPMEAYLGPAVLAQVLDLCRVPMPTGAHMIPQSQVGRVHHTLWQLFPDRARPVSEEAGRRTARYIEAHRIPRMARIALRWAPWGWAERRLTRAVAAHAWTFCGSGALATHHEDGDIHFIIHNNPLADTQARPPHLCHWHSAVFAELFTRLLGRAYHCREISCCAMGAEVCHFVVSHTAPPDCVGQKA